MSWSPRPPSAERPSRQPPLQPPHQGYPNQQNSYSNYQAPLNNTQQQQYWQTQQPAQYNQQYGGVYPPQQEYGNNANHFYQQQQPPQNYTNQSYNQAYQQGYNNQPQYQQTYQNHVQPNYQQGKPNNDSWEDNWDWGWDDTKQNQTAAKSAAQSVQAPLPQQEVFNNANVIEESFASTNTWNWSTDDKKEANQPVKQEPANKPAELPVTTNNVPQPAALANTDNVPPRPTEEVRSLSDRDVVKEKLPNLAVGKRFHLENLTPQWSIESQMSQESSDGPQTHSEGTYRSENMSRNSSKSSPGLNTDNSNFIYSQSALDKYPQSSEWSRHSAEDPTLIDNVQSGSRTESHDEITSSLQELNLANRETPVEVAHGLKEAAIEEPSAAPSHPPSVLPSNAAQSAVLPPPPLASVPPAPTSSSASLPPPPTSSMLPPTNFPTSSTNPFKQTGPFSHKKVPSSSPLLQSLPPSMSNTNLVSPGAVNKISQRTSTSGFGANLETTPDNSERPDQPHSSPFRPMPVPLPDNLEVAPQNDRNEYLQTAHLSSGDYGENTNFSNVPPPGLRRMVVGQQESEYQNLNMGADEPPPGLSRMVPGQQTEADNSYNQPSDNYLDRHIDGQLDGSRRPYGQDRQADGQITPDNYSQSVPRQERRPVGFDRREVPGEPSNDEFSQYQGSNYAGAEQRVVTGVDRDYRMPDTGISDVREQNVDGSDYSEQTPRNVQRNVIGVRETSDSQRNVIGARETSDSQRNVIGARETNDNQRNVIGARETNDNQRNVIGAREINEVQGLAEDQQREVTMEGENLQDLSLISSGEITYSREERLDGADLEEVAERKSSMDRGEERERRRGDRGWSREERRRERKRQQRYDTDDTDYYSDRERDRRRYREGSYSKPPRPDDKARRYDDRSRRYNTIERDKYVDERDGGSRRERRDRDRDRDRERDRDPARDRERDRDRDRYGRYRDIDPTRKHGNIKKEREEDRKRGDYSSGSRAGSREGHTDDDTRRHRDRHDRHDRHERRRREPAPDPYYDLSGGGLTPQQYQYYEHLRRTDPAAYMVIYKQLMAGHYHRHLHEYGSLGYDGRGEERASVHSGRSSGNGLKRNDTYNSLLNSEINTDVDASLNLQLEESTVRSERMTPFKYSTAHIKGSMSCRALVVVRGGWPADGAPAAVQLLSLAALQPSHPLLTWPGPLIKGVTPKKSVVEYCQRQASLASTLGAIDPGGWRLVWSLLAMMMRQQGVVENQDIAELLMEDSRLEADRQREADSPPLESLTLQEEPSPQSPVDEKEALNKLRELLINGNRQEALELAMSCGLWGHALSLCVCGERRLRMSVAARFLQRQAPRDPLTTLYRVAMGGSVMPASDPRWTEWRPHVAIILANSGPKPDHDQRVITQIGDTLSSRGLVYSAQFCYLCANTPFSRHPLAPLTPPTPATPDPPTPPRLSLLLADPHAPDLARFATDHAITATEIYEYAMSLNQEYRIQELQVYKYLVCTRLADLGEAARALRYSQQLSAALCAQAQLYPPRLLTLLAHLADRLQWTECPIGDDGEEGGSSEPGSPHRQWIGELTDVAKRQVESESQQSTPLHQPHQVAQDNNQQYGWQEQSQQQQQQYLPPLPPLPPSTSEAPPAYPPPMADPPLASGDPQYYDTWRPDNQTYDNYWQGDYGQSYGEVQATAGADASGAAEITPQITMPGAQPARPPLYADYDDDRPPSDERKQESPADTSKSSPSRDKSRPPEGKSSGWLGGILTKLTLRPPNQMKLPDDKNPTIVWDEKNKRWLNTDQDSNEEPGPPPPPPSNLMQTPPSMAGLAPPAGPLAAPVSNIFKMQKGRHIKQAYVDVLNPGRRNPAPAAPPPAPSSLLSPNNMQLHRAVVVELPSPAPSRASTGDSDGTEALYDPTQLSEEDSQPMNSGI